MSGFGGGGGPLMGRLARSNPETKGHQLAPGVLRRTLSYGLAYRGMLIVFTICIVASAALGVATPLLFKVIIDDGVLAGDRQVVIRTALIVAGIAVLLAVVTLVQRWCSARIGEGLIADLRSQVYDHVLSMPLAFFSRSNTGRLVSRLQSDVIGAQQAFTSTLSNVLSSIISVVLIVGAMGALSWRLTLASLVMLPIFMIPARIVGNRLAMLTRDAMNLNADLANSMTERFSVSGALLVKLFGRPQQEHEYFAGKAQAVAEMGVRRAMVGRFFITSLTLVAALATALVYGAGGLMAIEGSLTVGTLTALAGLLAQLYGPLMTLSNVRIDVMSALVSFERVFEVLDLEPAIRDAPAARRASGVGIVEFREVHFTYPDAGDSLASLEPAAAAGESPGEPVLNGLSFSVAPGETLALVGPSGAGKTTITNLVARLYDVSGGEVLVGGDDVRELSLLSLQQMVGYVTQDAHLFHETIRDNLLYAAPEATEQELRQALSAAQILTLVDRLPDGLDTVVGERGYRLSGGERQRFAIARLLLKAPAIVVLDEATAHLDSDSEAAVQAALNVAMVGTTSIVIAHRLSTVRKADQILVVEAGRITERGTHAELLAARGVYATLYATQFSDA